MKYNGKEEFLVILAIQELGEASIDEIAEYIENHWQELTETEPQQIPKDKILRYVRRWNKRKAVSGNIVNGNTVYSLADIPWFPKNQIIRCLKAPDDLPAKQLLDVYETKLGEKTSIRQPKSVYRDYKRFELTFETLDCVAGGIPHGERRLAFPKHPDGKPYIPINWFKGWMRQNSGLADLPQAVFVYKTGFSTGEFRDSPKLHTRLVKVKTGLTDYEYIGPGEQFTVTMVYPMHGTAIKKPEQLEQLFKRMELAPIRGLGSYPAAFGGRVKLLEIKEI